MVMRLHVEGASDEERARGLAAAVVALASAGVTPWQAALGLHARVCWDIGGFNEANEPTDAELDAAKAWDEAEYAALHACCEGWTVIPYGAHIEVTPDR
jgi:hypothetical protein